KIRTILSQPFSDREHHVGINGYAPGVHDLEFHRRVALVEHHFQVSAEAISGLGIAHGGGFSQHENPKGSRRVFGGDRVHLWHRDHARWEKRSGEEKVVARSGTSTYSAGNSDIRGKADSANPQHSLAESDEQ